MKRYRFFLFILLIIIFLFTVPACKSTYPNSLSDTPNIDLIKAKGKIVMLTNSEFPPFEYIGHAGKIEGIDVDVANEIAKDLGVDLEIIDMNFDFLIDSIKSNKGDFVAAGLTITPERQEQVLFSIQYVTSSQYMIIKKGSSLTPDNLKNSTIAVQEATKGDFYATDDLECENILRFNGAVEASQALISGKCDAVILDELPARSIVDANYNVVDIFPTALTSESYAFAIQSNKTDLCNAINNTLNRLISEGKINEFILNHDQ